MHKSVRKGITQAEFNEDASKVLSIEIAIIAIFLGVKYSSWWIGGGTYLGLMISFLIKPLAVILSIIISIAWGVIGFMIGWYWIDSTGAAVVIGIIALLVGLGYHIGAMEYVEDLS